MDVNARTLTLLQDLQLANTKEVARSQFDNGSSRILVTHSFAKKAGLKELPAEYCMQVVGKGWETVKGVMYIFDFINRSGEKIKAWGYGIDVISDPVEPTDLTAVRAKFPHVPDAAFISLEKKPLDMLIGLNFLGIHPTGGEGINKAGNLLALRSQFGGGWIIGGSDPLLKPAQVRMTAKALAMATISKVEIKLFEEKDIFEQEIERITNKECDTCDKCTFCKLQVESEDKKFLIDIENLGVMPPKRCERCKNCKFCSDEGILLSCKEEEEFRLINDSVQIKDGKTTCSFPFVKDPNILSNNKEPMLKRSQKLEQSLKRRGLLQAYNEEFQKFVGRGVLSEVTQEEIDSYPGPVNFISHHGVLQPHKVTTPLRLVSNSSQDNRGHSLNSLVPKGPNSLCDMYGMLLKFRSYEVGLAFDVSKAYHTVKTGVVEKFLRLLIWRMSLEEDWKIYGYDVLAFGDRSAASILEAAKRKCADLGEHIDPPAAKRIRSEMYVDDGATGSTKAEVERFVGHLVEGEYTGSFQQILGLGGFKIKSMVYSGCTDDKAIELLGSAVLGYKWDAKSDIMSVKFKVNLSRKKGKVPEYPDLKIEELERLRKIKFTKRNLLGFVAGTANADPLCIALPYTIKLRIGLKQIFDLDKNLGWDEEISEEAKEWWV